MCFAPQQRALFRHRNFQKWSEPLVFCTFWLGNVLRATTACNYSSLIWPARSAPAALASLLFDPPEPVFRDVPTFSRTCIFFLLIFSLLTLLTSAFQLSILSEVSLLNFLRWYSLIFIEILWNSNQMRQNSWRFASWLQGLDNQAERPVLLANDIKAQLLAPGAA